MVVILIPTVTCSLEIIMCFEFSSYRNRTILNCVKKLSWHWVVSEPHTDNLALRNQKSQTCKLIKLWNTQRRKLTPSIVLTLAIIKAIQQGSQHKFHHQQEKTLHKPLIRMVVTQVINQNGYVNVTSDYFKPLWSSGLTMANSGVFLCLYTIYMIGLVAFLIRVTRKVQLKRNHKILFSMTTIFVLVQIILLIMRIVSDALQIESRILTERKELVGWDLFLAVQIFAGIITFFMLINFVILMVIMFFVQRML